MCARETLVGFMCGRFVLLLCGLHKDTYKTVGACLLLYD